MADVAHCPAITSWRILKGKHREDAGLQSGVEKPLQDSASHGRLMRFALMAAVALGIGFAAWKINLSNNTPARDIQTGRYDAALGKLLPKAEAGDPWSQNQVGNLYMLGLGTEVNMEEALKWYMRAALNNWADAQINVSLMYRYGRGVPSDLVRSWAWLRHARSNGKEIAEIYMSWMAGSLTLTPSQMQVAKERYFELESLRPEGFK
jgi:TPR repeat protein